MAARHRLDEQVGGQFRKLFDKVLVAADIRGPRRPTIPRSRARWRLPCEASAVSRWGLNKVARIALL